MEFVGGYEEEAFVLEGSRGIFSWRVGNSNLERGMEQSRDSFKTQTLTTYNAPTSWRTSQDRVRPQCRSSANQRVACENSK
jgi:hypothetical protein